MNKYLITIISNLGTSMHCIEATSSRLAISEILIDYEKDENTSPLANIKCKELSANNDFWKHHIPEYDDDDD